MATTTLRYNWPYSSRPPVSSPFGSTRSNKTRWHIGTDFTDPNGGSNPPIYAVTEGTVVHAGYQNPSNVKSGLGLYILIDHDNDPYSTIYGHLSSRAVEVGQHVNGGQKIGLQGNTGSSTGPHLHFQVNIGKGKQSISAPVSKSLGSIPVVDPIYLLTNGAESTPNITTNRDSSQYNIFTNSVGGGYEGVFDLGVGGTKLLEPSDDERKYGVAVYDVVQSMIRGTTASGVGESADVFQALQKYCKYLYYYLNSNVSVATLQLQSMPWIRPGFNVWVDPLQQDEVYYVNSVTHVGSAGNGVYTTLGVTFGRDRSRFQSSDYVFGSLKPGNSDNVLINEILEGPDDFSTKVVGTQKEFDDVLREMNEYYQKADYHHTNILQNSHFLYFYDMANHSSSANVTPVAETATSAASVAPSSEQGIEVGSSVILNGRVHYDQQGSRPGKTFTGQSGKITKIGTLSNPYPYHFETYGWVSASQIGLVASPVADVPVNTTTNQVASEPATVNFESVNDIQKFLDDMYKEAPEVIQARIKKNASTISKAKEYMDTHYATRGD